MRRLPAESSAAFIMTELILMALLLALRCYADVVLPGKTSNSY
jgi:hypothetical protein